MNQVKPKCEEVSKELIKFKDVMVAFRFKGFWGIYPRIISKDDPNAYDVKTLLASSPSKRQAVNRATDIQIGISYAFEQ